MQANRITLTYVLLMTLVVVASNVLVQYPLPGTLFGVSLGDILTFGAFISVFFATSAIESLRAALNIAYRQKETRSYPVCLLESSLLVVLSALFFGAAHAAVLADVLKSFLHDAIQSQRDVVRQVPWDFMVGKLHDEAGSLEFAAHRPHSGDQSEVLQLRRMKLVGNSMKIGRKAPELLPHDGQNIVLGRGGFIIPIQLFEFDR